jgi:hypothetical protein
LPITLKLKYGTTNRYQNTRSTYRPTNAGFVRRLIEPLLSRI